MTVQELLEGELDATLRTVKGERNDCWVGYRSGYYTRNYNTRVGNIELRIPQDRNGLFSTEIFERYGRSEKL